jgi:hypothetical protein
VIEPIHRWTKFSDDDCFDMFERVSKLEQERAAKTNQNHRQSPATIGQQPFPMATTTPSNESTMAVMGMGGGFEGQMMPNGNGGGNGPAAPFFPTTMPTENEGLPDKQIIWFKN